MKKNTTNNIVSSANIKSSKHNNIYYIKYLLETATVKEKCIHLATRYLLRLNLLPACSSEHSYARHELHIQLWLWPSPYIVWDEEVINWFESVVVTSSDVPEIVWVWQSFISSNLLLWTCCSLILGRWMELSVNSFSLEGFETWQALSLSNK